MAYLPIQRGALVDRLRRFLGVVGPFSGKVDETLAATVLAADLSSQPYDTNSNRFATSRRVPAGGGEARYRLGIINETTTLVVVDRIQVQSNKLIQLLVGGQIVGGFGSKVNGRSRDFTTLNAGNWETAGASVPLQVAVPSFYNIAAVADNATPVWVGEANVAYDIPVGWVLAPGQTMYFLAATPIAAADFVNATFWGRIMLDPALNVPR